ncbi:hypothetical protein [Acidocella sp.]|uniref:hypothetical protein n=1 Tax=Acidocella sp. TaxID=50710 RepID=UPI003D07FD32
MNRFTLFASAAALALSLTPLAAQARSGAMGSSARPVHLVRIAHPRQNQAVHGRLAETARQPASFTTAPGAGQYANSTGHGNGDAG